MTSVRKQTIVISVLIVLIACAGLFARSFNETLTDNALSGQVVETSEVTDPDAQAVASKAAGFFANGRMDKEAKYDTSVAMLNEMKNNKTLSKKARETASLRMIDMIAAANAENKIETQIKGRGFEDALCVLSDKHAEVFVKTSAELTTKQVHEIMQVIMQNTKLEPSRIYIKAKE